MHEKDEAVAALLKGSGSLVFETDTVVVHMSGNKEDAGRITATNNGLLRVFGYNRPEVVGHLVSILMPEIFAARHAEFLEHFFLTGRQTVFDQERLLFALHRDGHCFHIKLLVKQIPNLDSGIQYVGMMRLASDACDYILTTEKGVIDCFSKHLGKLIGQPPSLFKENEISVGVLAPELEKVYAQEEGSARAKRMLKKFMVSGGRATRLTLPTDFMINLNANNVVVKREPTAGENLLTVRDEEKDDKGISRTSIKRIRDESGGNSPKKPSGEVITLKKSGQVVLRSSKECMNSFTKYDVTIEIQDLVYTHVSNVPTAAPNGSVANKHFVIRVVKVLGLSHTKNDDPLHGDEISVSDRISPRPNKRNSKNDMSVLSPNMCRSVLQYVYNWNGSSSSHGISSLTYSPSPSKESGGVVPNMAPKKIEFRKSLGSDAEETRRILRLMQRDLSPIHAHAIGMNSPLLGIQLNRRDRGRRSVMTPRVGERSRGRSLEGILEEKEYPEKLDISISRSRPGGRQQSAASPTAVPAQEIKLARHGPAADTGGKILPPNAEVIPAYKPTPSEERLRRAFLKAAAKKNREKAPPPVVVAPTPIPEEEKKEKKEHDEEGEDSEEDESGEGVSKKEAETKKEEEKKVTPEPEVDADMDENEPMRESGDMLNFNDASSSGASARMHKSRGMRNSIRTAIDEHYIPTSIKNMNIVTHIGSLFLFSFGSIFSTL